MKNVKRLWFLLLISIGLITSQLASGQVGQIIWEENFNSLNTSTWNYVLGNGCDLGTDMCGWGNFELEYYRQENVSVQDIAGESGNKGLYIQAKREAFGGSSFTSGKLNTAKKLAVKYGMIEVRMKTPKVATGLWPAFWLLGTSIDTDIWPKCGEIDMMEMGHKASEITRQQNPGVSPNKYVGSNLIWYEKSAIAPGNLTGAASISYDYWYCTPYVAPTDLDDRFIIYRMYWDDKAIRFTTEDNGVEHDMYTGPFPISPAASVFQRPFYFLVNLAVGGNFTDAANAGQVTAALPSSMIVDYIRVRKWNGKGEIYDDNRGIANAGADKTVDSGVKATLDGSASYGSISSYVWKENGVQIATGKTASLLLTDGTHNITLFATDAKGNVTTDEVVYAVGKISNIGEVIFEEQFNTFDATVWNYSTGNGCDQPSGCGFGNWELQYYKQNNVYVAPIPGEAGNNALVLEAKSESFDGSSFTSGKVNSQSKLAVKYGLIEFRMKAPAVQTGLWPAVWMLGVNHPTAGWPYCGEVDMMEMGHKSSVRSGEGWGGSANNYTGSNLIWYTPKAVSPGNPSGAASIAYDKGYNNPYFNGGDLSSKFVTYRCYWTQDTIRFTVVDNNVEHNLYTASFPLNPLKDEAEAFRKPYYLIANLAVGGTFTDAATANQVTATLPAKMYIDYIKVMKFKGQGEIIRGKQMLAVAGGDIAVVDKDKDGKETITLDGSASQGDIVSYEWYINGTRFATGAKATVSLGTGYYGVTLKTIDSANNISTDEQTVDIQEILWEDNFNALNSTYWNTDLGNGCSEGQGMCGWGNQELQSYQPGNLTIEPVAGETGNNALVITAKKETSPDGSPFTSGKINTSNKVSVKYGLVEVRLKAPAVATGLWPAAWLLGANKPTAGWPQCGEMDMMEMGHKAAERLKQGASDSISANRYVGSNAIWYDPKAITGTNPTGAASIAFDAGYNQPYVSLKHKPLNERYVTYRLYWTAAELRYTVIDEGTEYDLYTGPFPLNGNQPAFNKPFYLLLNLAVGGNFTDATTAGQVTAAMPAKMYVDYMRVLKYKGCGSVAMGNGVTAVAGADVILTDIDASGSESVTLDGSQSATFKQGNTIASYVWSKNGSQIATGAIPTVNLPIGSHFITLTVTDNQGNSDTDEVIVVITNGIYTSVRKVVASSRELTIYPSPVTDVLNIEADEDLVERVELYNISGAKVLDVVGVNQIDMSALPKGLYVVVATIEGEVLVKKVVKK